MRTQTQHGCVFEKSVKVDYGSNSFLMSGRYYSHKMLKYTLKWSFVRYFIFQPPWDTRGNIFFVKNSDKGIKRRDKWIHVFPEEISLHKQRQPDIELGVMIRLCHIKRIHVGMGECVWVCLCLWLCVCVCEGCVWRVGPTHVCIVAGDCWSKNETVSFKWNVNLKKYC